MQWCNDILTYSTYLRWLSQNNHGTSPRTFPRDVPWELLEMDFLTRLLSCTRTWEMPQNSQVQRRKIWKRDDHRPHPQLSLVLSMSMLNTPRQLNKNAFPSTLSWKHHYQTCNYLKIMYKNICRWMWMIFDTYPISSWFTPWFCHGFPLFPGELHHTSAPPFASPDPRGPRTPSTRTAASLTALCGSSSTTTSERWGDDPAPEGVEKWDAPLGKTMRIWANYGKC